MRGLSNGHEVLYLQVLAATPRLGTASASLGLPTLTILLVPVRARPFNRRMQTAFAS
jgi:hypothetical protein